MAENKEKSQTNTLVGTTLNDTLEGSGDDDLLQGLGGNDLLIGDDGDDTLEGGSGNDAIFAGDDDDSLDGGEGDDSLSGDDGDDILKGGRGDDIIVAGDDDDLLVGGGGADLLSGGKDRDTASYESSKLGVSVDLSTGLGSGGDTQGDKLSEIENLIGSDQEDILIGDRNDNVLEGGRGADSIDGGSGSDTASYKSSDAGVSINLKTMALAGGDAEGDKLTGIENLIGSSQVDNLVGDDGDNILEGGDGADSLVGGEGNDSASYQGSESGVSINLEKMTFLGGDAEGDSLIGIENLIGSDEEDSLVGDRGNNALFGEDGDDSIFGGLGVDTLDGGDDDDSLVGGAGDDELDGGDDDDLLIGGVGADTIVGGDGEDTASYQGSNSSVKVDLLAGIGSGGDAKGDVLSEIENLQGSQQDDTLVGDDKENIIEGGAGADILDGGGDEDTASYEDSSTGVKVNLALGSGSDGDAAGDKLLNIENLKGSRKNDTLIGDRDRNVIEGGDGTDTVDGGAGDDILKGGDGADYLVGGEGNDTASYEDSTAGVTVNLSTGMGNGGDAEGDSLKEAENLVGSEQDDRLIGNDDANILAGGIGADFLDGGAGADTATYENSKDGVEVDLSAGVGNEGDAQGDKLTNIENIIGSEDEDKLIGDDANNSFFGRDEEDELRGNGGDDYLSGGKDYDTLFGGSGEDTLKGDSGSDTLEGGRDGDVIDGGAGIDTASYRDSQSVNINLATGVVTGGDANGDLLLNIENIIGSGEEDILRGDSRNNVLEGGAAGDRLDGGIGSDTASYENSEVGVNLNLSTNRFIGGDAQGDRLVNIENLSGSEQDDIIVGDEGKNTLRGLDGADQLQGKDGDDKIYAGEGNDTLEGGTGNDVLEGNEDDDKLFGNEGNDALEGGTGDDTIEGGVGFDFLSGEGGEDSLKGGANNDTLKGGSENDRLFGEAGADRLNGGSENDFLDGGSGDDFLVGNTGNDTIEGGSGNDTLVGGIGTDILTGGADADIFQFKQRRDSSLDRGLDSITDLQIGIDTIDGPQAISTSKITQLGNVKSLDASDIKAVLTKDRFTENKAAIFTMENRTFLAFNDGNAGFSEINDGVIEITGYTGKLSELEITDSNTSQSASAKVTASKPTFPSATNRNINRSNYSIDFTKSKPKRILINNVDEIDDAIAQAKPGDSLVLKDGVYRDLSVHLNQPGIEFRAETPGGVTITGSSDIYIEADHVSVSGFKFDRITDDMAVVQFSGARYSRLSNNAFYDSGNGVKDHIIDLGSSSQYNRVDRNLMVGNKSIGIAVGGTRKISSKRDNIEQLNNWYNRIERNYLKDVPYPGGSVNGREGIQLGQLKNSADAGITGRSIVEYNLLENVDYDPEVISVKTNDNIVRFNTIRGSKNGGLVVRAGDDNLVEGNFIFDAKEGIRINGTNTKVVNNYIKGTKRGIRFRYEPSNATVANNTIINTKDFGITAEVEPDFPWSANIYNNFLQSDNGILFDASLNLGEVSTIGNITNPQGIAKLGLLPGSSPGNKISQSNSKLFKSDQLEQQDSKISAIDGSIFQESDNNRTGINDENIPHISPDNEPLTSNDVGAFWTSSTGGKKISTNTSKLLYGTSNNDFLNTSQSKKSSILYGRDGNDNIIVGSNNFAFGGNGNDLLEAQFGDGGNLLFAGQGNDEITVRNRDRAYGGDGDDLFNAQYSIGGNYIHGGNGNDEFLLGSGDRVLGGRGRDRFFVYSGGNNTISGGEGADEFWIANGDEADSPNTITDFQVGTDVLVSSGLGLTFNDLKFFQENGNTTIMTENTKLIKQAIALHTKAESEAELKKTRIIK
ncbi:MAG: chondroitinase-B domain-containing protein, partial [Cyanobacteria bacterium J06639_18]